MKWLKRKYHHMRLMYYLFRDGILNNGNPRIQAAWKAFLCVAIRRRVRCDKRYWL
jgi:hypothetical protein